MTTVEILARVADLHSTAFPGTADTELATRRRGGHFFVGCHSLARDAGGPANVTSALQAATPGDQEAADATLTPAQWQQIIQIALQIFAAIAANKPPVP